MVFDTRGRRGTAVSAGILLSALAMTGVANAAPDSDAASPSADRAGASTAPRSPGGADRTPGPRARAASPRSDRSAARATTSPAAARAVSSARVAHATPPPSEEPVIAAPAPQAPGLLSAVAAPAIGPADALAGGSGAPLPAAMAWAVLAAARSEAVRRTGGAGSVATAAAIPALTVNAPVGQIVSPLGTPEQTAAETTAMRTVHTLPVLAMKGVLGIAWRIIGGREYSQVGGPDQQNLSMLGNAVDEWAMASAFQSMILNSNEPVIVTQVAPPHRWYGIDAAGSRVLYDNPDTIYRFVGVNYASQYVITGRMPDQDPKASFSVLTGLTGNTAAVLDAATLQLSPDRTFAITVSGEPAKPGETNHIQITPDTTLIAIRDTLSDWNTEDPMGLSIQRTDGPPKSLFGQFGGFAFPGIGPLVVQSPFLTTLVSLIPPLPAVPPIVRGTITSLLMLRGFSEEAKYIRVATTDVTGKPKEPNVFTDPTTNASFLATQLQSAGYFQLADDQALVLTVTPNNAGYFTAPVTNDWTVTDNYWSRQTSLNNAQARSNPDGSYTLVVSPAEPLLADGTSVWNWISTGGLHQGTMAIRFQSIDPDNPVRPTVSSQVVPLSDLASVLPAGTVTVNPEERALQLAARSTGFDRRFAPYPQTT